ncbi:hypothetical protein Q5752_000062 [Cryptotrichosporon argae]
MATMAAPAEEKHAMPAEPAASLPVPEGSMPPAHSYGHHYFFQRLREERPLPSKPRLAWMVAALFFIMFLAGWNDASQGPILPQLQAYYNVNYLVISIVWVFNALGFGLSGLTNVFLTDRFGFGIVAPLGSVSQALGYALMCWGGPYPLFCFAFVLNGFGLGLQDAQVNALVSRLPRADIIMFLVHAVYGLGATVAPLVSTQFVERIPDRVYLYYAVSLGMALATAALVILVFAGRTEDQVVGRRVDDARTPAGSCSDVPRLVEAQEQGCDQGAQTNEAAALDAVRPAVVAEKPNSTSSGKMGRILRLPAVHFMAVYIMFYVGIEVTIGGWATTFIIDERRGGANTGYITSGYFGGITVGRVVLIPVSEMIGGQNAIYVYSLIAIALEIVIWLTHSIVGNAVAFAFIGVVLGPMYPIVMMIVVNIIPGELQSGTIGWIASLGQVGSAIMPFITGGISERYGVWILQPLIIAFLGASVVLWALVPRSRKRVDA